MSTFTQGSPDPAGSVNARQTESNTPKDNATPEDIKQADDSTTEAGDGMTPEESASEAADRHIASTELPAGKVTDPETQALEDRDDPDSTMKTTLANEAAEKIVPGAKSGPKVDGTIRNDNNGVAYAPPGSLNAAFNGVQQDAAGHVDSVGTDNSSKSGVRT